MKLSTRTRYGLRALLMLAENYGKGPLQIKLIARDQEISVKYLEQLLTVLKAAGLVKSIRGNKGGYVLAKPPGQIRASDCFDCLEGPVITTDCVDNEKSCPRSTDCVSRWLWAEIQNAVSTLLESTTFQDLVEKNTKLSNITSKVKNQQGRKIHQQQKNRMKSW
jgi:Rrf2 family transcriptional regulator, cysteine metabolism repressor